MDERHWWFAAKLQETFHFGGYDNPTLLEDFLSESHVIELINAFLAPGEPHKLFFYCDTPVSASPSTPLGDPIPLSRQLHILPQLSKDVLSEGCVCLYVLRRDTGGEVDVTQMERELFCGELRHSVLSSLASLLTEVYTPLLYSQRNWGECSEESIINFLQSFDKFSNSLLETAIQAQVHHPLLRRPSQELRYELAGHQVSGTGGRGIALLGEVLMECEALVSDWIGTIESILIEATDERLEDPHGSPLAELSKWQRRQTVLCSLVEQLKTKESKSVLGALIATKSRLLKKWKNIDGQITDAFNNSRDRVRYLEALSPYLNALLSTPITSVTTILASLTTMIKQMDGLSRAYARSGYLGILFIKISNALVLVCRNELESYSTNMGRDSDQFWSLLAEAVISETDPDNSKKEHPLLTKLNSCVSLSTTYRDSLILLKDTLLQSVNFALSTNTGLPRYTSHLSTHGSAKKSTSKGTSGGESSRSSVTSTSTLGISLHATDIIMSELSLFTARVLKVLDIVSTLAQFKQLNLHSRLEGLPRISGLWHFDQEAGAQTVSIQDSGHSWGQVVPEVERREGGTESSSDVTMTTPDYLEQLLQPHSPGGLVPDGPLPTLKEESVVGSASVRSSFDQQDTALSSSATQSTASATITTSTLSAVSPNKAHSDLPSDSVALMIETSVRLIHSRLEQACSQGVEDVFCLGKRRETFLRAYQEYAGHVGQMEADLCAYLKAVFADMNSSSRALDVTSRFLPVSSRIALQESIHRCMMVAFSKYSIELDDIQAAYEGNKGSPPLSRNVPPVAGAISWARQLLRRIEEPMKVFKQDNSVLQSKESVYVSKQYNRLVTALLKYEALWLSQWRGSIEVGRAGLKATLLSQQEAATGGVVVTVNCKDRLLQLMAETKALLRLEVTIPDSARSLLTQESRIKLFKQQLECVLSDFYSIQDTIDPLIKPLLTPTIERCMRTLLPGWTTLTWSSMNIDAFLYRVNTSVASLRELVEKVMTILQERVFRHLTEIFSSSLFDLDLATSKTWIPDEFSQVILSSITDRSNAVLEKVFTIRTALLEIISLTSAKGEEKTLSLIATALQASTPQHQAIASVSSSDSGKRTHQSRGHLSHSGVLSGAVSTRNTSAATLGATGHPLVEIMSKLGSVEENVLMKFCELVFDSVGRIVVKSHDQLCSCLWSSEALEPGTEHKSLPLSSVSKAPVTRTRVVTFDLPDSPSKGNSAIDLESELINSISQTILLPESTKATPPLQLEVEIHFLIPRICLKPSLDEVQSQLSHVSAAIARVLHLVQWWVGPNAGRPLYEVFESKGTIHSFHEGIMQAMEGVSPRIEECLQSLRLYDFLWQQDMHSTCKYLLSSQPKTEDCSSHIENFMILEEKIEGLRTVFSVGPLQLSSRPVKNSLRALAVTWKIEFASYLHEQAKTSLQSAVTQREAMFSQLSSPVETLEQLKSTLELLHTITDMQSLIDEIYLPVERLYTLLREYNPHLPRGEVEQVDSLRDDWKALTDLAEQVQHKLLSQQRLLFEREVDKKVKAFVVRTIQFRNSFDTEGPLVPGLIPSEAVTRLGSFLDGCEELKSQRDLLTAVQKLLDIPPTPYPELDQTEQDLSYLRALYSNYQQFIDFDKRFRQELWAEVDLDGAIRETERYWCAYESLPLEQQDWDAARKLKTEISQYRQVLPLLKQLHSKEIKNRHWLQVMNVVNCTFQLEGSIFKMTHLLDAGLLHHVPAIQEIVHCAQCELDLEEKFFSIEEEWSEASLIFLPYKTHGHAILDQGHTLSLMEQLEHAHTLLATMLMSKHVGPLREEASLWAIKLANMADTLQLWMSVQELWQNLEAVFNTPSTAKEFPEEAVKFASIHKRWLKLMKAAHQTRSVFLCCMEGETPRYKQLAGIRSGLEDCKKSLSFYLRSKRLVFPRLYFVSDDSLLSILSDPTSPTTVQSHLGSLFGATASILTTPSTQDGDIPSVTGVVSAEGEKLNLIRQVPLNGGVEQWSSQLLSTIQLTVRGNILSALSLQQDGSSFSLEECALTQPTQVVSMALFSQWTRECEQALLQCRYDRRALPGVRGRFGNWSVGKLTTLLMRNCWKITDEPLAPFQRVKLEALAILSLWLRDVVEDLCQHKLRDVSDFEWQRYIRPYLSDDTRPPSVSEEGVECETRGIVMRCLDQELGYGYEYSGCDPLPVFTPHTDNYITSLTQGLSFHLGSQLTGPTGSSKVQLIKGVGQLCGRFVFTLHCSPLTRPVAVARIFEGLAQDGTWLCLADIHTLCSPALSVVSQMMLIIRSALQARQATCTLRGSEEIPLRSQLAVFLTSSPGWILPSSVSSQFRTFSATNPDPTLFLRAKCSGLGLRAPKALANKLVTLQNMVKEQFSSLPLTLSTHTIIHVLEAVKRKLCMPKSQTHIKPTPEHIPSAVMDTSEPRVHSTSGRSPGHDLARHKGKSLSQHNTPTVLPAGAVKEHSIIAQTLVGMVGPMFPDQEFTVFVQMIRDIFGGGGDLTHIHSHPLTMDLPPPPIYMTPYTPTASRRFVGGPLDMGSVPDLLKEEVVKTGLVPTEKWMRKVEQVFMMTQLKHAVMLAGPPGTGKSSALSTVASTVTTAHRGEGGAIIKLIRVFPGVFESLSEIYGHVTSIGDWVDGVLTDTIRKAHKAAQTVSWLCLDGDLGSAWAQCLPEILGRSRSLTLGNGEHLYMSESSLKLIFETGSVDQVSPAALLNCGMVYFDSSVVGWRAVVERWCRDRSTREADTINKYLSQVMDPIMEFVLIKAGKGRVYSEVGLVETCLAYLGSLLNTSSCSFVEEWYKSDAITKWRKMLLARLLTVILIYRETAEVYSEVHVERLLLFSLIWGYGGVLVGEREQRKLSQLLKTLTNILPDDDSEFSVFDYYVDESGEWDIWQSRVPQEANYQVDMLGGVYVDTAETIRTDVLLELSLSAGRHTLLVGPHGSGKTAICRHFLQERALAHIQSETLKQSVLNGHTRSSSLHEFMQVNFHHRQGYTFGPKHHKKLHWFIDDLHSPLKHTHNCPCTSHEYLRQLSDTSGIHNLQKKNEWCAIEDLVIFACLTSDSDALLDPRLRRHLAIVHLPELSIRTVKSIISLQLATYLSVHTEDVGKGTLDNVTQLLTEVFSRVREVLKVSEMTGRAHYLFSLRQLESVYQGLCNCADGSSHSDRWGLFKAVPHNETPSRLPATKVVCPHRLSFSMSHELKRALSEGVCRTTDSKWLNRLIEEKCQQLMLENGDIPSMPLSLSGIPTEVKQDDQSTSSISPVSSLPEIILNPVSDWGELRVSLAQFLRRYREEQGESFTLELSQNTIRSVVSLHRTLKQSKGNCVLVGALGLPLHNLATFALYIAGYSTQTLDTSKKLLFKDGLRALFRQAGLEGRPVSVILNERDLKKGYVIDVLNSLLASGELPTLFTNDEMEGLLHALVPTIKRDFPSEETNPLQYFTARIYRNLRVVLCLSPLSELLGPQAHDYKGVVECSKVIWTQDWNEEFVHNFITSSLSTNFTQTHINDPPRETLTVCLSAIHCYVMKETGQLTHTGQQPGHLKQAYLPKQAEFTQLLSPTTKQSLADILNKNSERVDSPLSFECLVERVLELDKEMSGSSNEFELPYVGPTKLQHFIECFCEIFKQKHLELNIEKINLSKALETIRNTQQEVSVMKNTVKELKQKYEEASRLSSTLLCELTAKSCQLEQLKALLGEGSSVLSAMQMVREQERLLIENEEDDDELLALFGDHPSSHYDALLQKLIEQVTFAENEEQAAKQRMVKSKESALHWQSKIDRNTIDQIKSLNNPPRLVGTIMELMFSLLQQYGESNVTQTGDQSMQSTPVHASTGHTGTTGTALSRRRSLAISHSGAVVTETAKMEKEQWQAVQSSIGDSQKFLDLVNRLKWQDGLSPDAVKLIESKLATSSNLSTVSSENTRKQSSSLEEKNLITVAMARHAAESAATMCGFAISIVHYSNSFQPYKLALEKLHQARRELNELESRSESAVAQATSNRTDMEDLVEEMEMTEEGVVSLQEEVDSLHNEFDTAVIEKHSLGQSCQQLTEKLKTANHLLESLKTQEDAWQKRLDTLPSLEVVTTNCILAAAFTIYCPILKTSQRHLLFCALLDICKYYRLPTSDDLILTPSTYPKFMIGEVHLYHFLLESLPPDLTSQQNGCFITYPLKVWPLILDPLDMAVTWLTTRNPSAVIVKHQSSDLLTTLEKCMLAGSIIVVTDVDTQRLVTYKPFNDILHVRKSLCKAKSIQKVLVNNKEIECHPNFKLVMITSDPLNSLPPIIATLTSTVMFQPERGGMADLLLDSFLHLQNPKSFHDRKELRRDMYDQAQRSQSVEAELLKLLAMEDSSHVDDPKVTKAILLQNKAYDDAKEGLTKALTHYSLISEVHLSVLRSLSAQASVITDVVCAMGFLLSVYQTTFSNVQTVFLTFVEQAGSRIQGEDSLIKMTRSAYSHFVRGYFEKDRLLFSFFLALEIEISRGNCRRQEVEFLVSPGPGRQFIVKGLASQAALVGELVRTPAVNFGKKPFDWLSDSQWQTFLMLASHFSWVHEIIEKQGKDGKETVWRTVAEGISPETINLAEGLGFKLPPVHQLLLMCAMRPERSSQFIVSFISSVLDSGIKQKRLNYDTPPDLNKMAKGLDYGSLPLVLYRDEPDLLVTKLRRVALKQDISLIVCHLHGSEDEDYHSALNALQEASSKGQWLLLHHAHTCSQLIRDLPSLLSDLPQRDQWKVWLSVHSHSTIPTVTLLKFCSKVVLESPLTIQASVLHSLNSTAGDLVTISSRQEWLPLLHNVAMFHATLRLRKYAYKHAWVEGYQWTQSQLMDTLRFLAKEFQYSETNAPGLSGVKPISWSGIRHMIVEVFYGSVITNPTDLARLAALADHWIHPGGPRRESGRYHISSQFFVPETRLSVLLHVVENATPPLVFTAELCGLHYTPLIQLGWSPSLFPLLIQLTKIILYQAKPLTPTVVADQIRRKTSFTSCSANSTTITSQANAFHSHGRNNQGIFIEKLPSFIQVSSQILETSVTKIPRSTLQQFVMCPLLLKELCLQNTVEKVLESIPQPWKKELLFERLKRHGEESPLGLFLRTETTTLAECLTTIIASLQDIQHILLSSSNGDFIPSYLVDSALSLLTLSVPRYWHEVVGSTSPPAHWPLKEWVQDLVTRFFFMDRFLAGGLAKTPTYWLGAFFNPQGLLSIVQQNLLRSICGKGGALEQLTFRADLTSRDKDHIRDPPPEGELFVYGVYLWGCGYEKSANLDLQDIPPKGYPPTPLPVIHLSLTTKSNPPPDQQANILTTESKGPKIHHCPCFLSNSLRVRGEGSDGVLFTLTISSSEVTPLRWNTRNLACTLRPF